MVGKFGTFQCKWLIVVGLALTCDSVQALLYGQDQALDVRLVVHTGSNEQRIKSLQFSSDSSQLFVGGHDKRVYVWNLIQNEKGHIHSGLAEAPIFWEISRGNRGAIEDISISSQGKLAIAGSAARSYKDTYIFDITERRLIGLLPKDRETPGLANTSQNSSILDLDWSPSGTRLATVDFSGRLCVWDVGTSVLLAAFEVDKSPLQNRCVAFLNDDTLLATYQEMQVGSIAVINLKKSPPTLARLSQDHQGQALGLATIPKTKIWASSDLAQNLYFWRDQELIHTEKLKGENEADSGRVAVSLHTSGANARFLLVNIRIIGDSAAEDRAEYQLWDLLPSPPVKVDSVTLDEPTGLRAAISPDELWVAGIDNRRHTVRIFELRRDGTFLRLPNGSRHHITLDRRSSSIKTVRFTADQTHRLGLTTDHEPNRVRVLDLSRAHLENNAPQNVAWIDSQTSPDQWQVRPLADGAIVSLIRNNVEQGRISLNQVHQGLYSTHAWITDPERRNSRAIAISTEFYGIYVYSMPENGVCRLLRYYRDHSDQVRSMSVSSDASYLASGANDATVKIWSLKALQTPDPRFPAASLWGCAFEVENQQLIVKRVVPEGIAASRGMKEGDVISAVEDSQGKYETAEKMLAAIQRVGLADQVGMTLQRTKQRFAIVPGWEPIASLVVDRHDEWGLWTPKGYYKATAHGDHLFGWVETPVKRWVADPIRTDAATPKFIPAKQRRGDFEKDEVLEKLFAGISPPPVVPEQPRPQIRIIEPRWEQPVDPSKPIKVSADVRLPVPAKEFNVDAFVGLSPINRVLPERVDNNTVRYHWTVPSAEAYENLLVRVTPTDTHSAHGNHVEQMGYFRTQPKVDPRNQSVKPPPTRDAPRIFVAGIAVAKSYPVSPLQFPVSDVKSIAEVFCRPDRPHFFEPGESTPMLLLEDQVNDDEYGTFVSSISEKLTQARIKRTDILLVLISGHGEHHHKNGFGFKTPTGSIPWISSNKSRKTHSFEALAAIPCRKLVLLDACQSGGTVNALWGPASWKNDQIRSWTEFQAMTFSSSSQDQSSYEHPEIGHSYFTNALLTAIDGAADGFALEGQAPNRDGEILFSEIIGYVTQNTHLQATVKVPQAPQFNQLFMPFTGFPLFGVTPK